MYQAQNAELLIYLCDNVGDPKLAVPYDQMNVKFWNHGQESFTTIFPVDTDVVELGEGFYVLRIAKENFPNVGAFFIEVTGMFKTFSKEYFVEPTPLSFLQGPAVCVVSGNIVDISGAVPGSKEEISFRVAKVPNTVGGSLVTSERFVMYPDAYGNFSIQLLRFSEVIVEIKRTGINYKFTVPDLATAPLLSLLPPI